MKPQWKSCLIHSLWFYPFPGCSSLSDCLSVQPKGTPTPQLACTSCDGFPCQASSPSIPPTPTSQCAETLHNFLESTEHGLSPTSTLIQPELASSEVPICLQGHQCNPQGLSHTPSLQGAPGGDADPLFIRATSVVEMVCGERMYKCSACLHYYPGLGPLVEHVKNGWRDGFSCRVFYRKLKNMHSTRTRASANGAPGTMTVSGCMPQSSTITTSNGSATPAAMATEGIKSKTGKEKKMDRVYEWLETSGRMFAQWKTKYCTTQKYK